MDRSPFEQRSRDPRAFSTVLEDIVANVQEIIRSEVRLAKTEVSEKLTAATKPAGMLAIGSVTAMYAAGFLLLSVVYGLSTVVEPWAAALIVAGALLAVATVLAIVGRRRLRRIRLPGKTIKSVKENVTWLKDQIR